MKPGDKFTIIPGGISEIKYEICSVRDFIATLENGTQTVPFEDPQRLCIGFIVDGKAVAMTLSDIKSCRSSMPEWIRDDLNTPDGRSRIAARCSIS